jgi:hypothetical protein
MSKYWRLRGFTFDKFGIILLFIHTVLTPSDDLFSNENNTCSKLLLLEQDDCSQNLIALVQIQMTESWMVEIKIC